MDQGTKTKVLNPMRQQLDELDALLQRMLALPVNHLDEPAGKAPAVQESPRARPVVAPAPPVPAPVSYATPQVLPAPTTVVMSSAAVAPPPVAKEPEASPFAFGPPRPGAAVAEPPAVHEKGPALEPRPARPEVRLPILERHLRQAERKAADRPGWLWPLVFCNDSYDRIAVRLGGPGLWLMRPGGRNLVGWVGLLCLAAAAALAALDWFGWTW